MERVDTSESIERRRWWQRSYTRLALLTSLAVLAAYIIAEALPFADPIPAAITAAVATRAAFHHAAKETAFQILGALLGALVALAFVSIIGTGPFVLFLLVLLAFALARVLHLSTPDESPFVAASIAVTMILVVGTHFTNELALERFNGVAIGALCSIECAAARPIGAPSGAALNEPTGVARPTNPPSLASLHSRQAHLRGVC